MSRLLKYARVLQLSGFSVFFVFIFLATSCTNKSSDDKGRVVLYCSVDQAVAEPIIARFEELTGIKALVRFDTESSKTVGLVEKIRAESGNPAADVFWSSEIFYTIRLCNEGLPASYNSSVAEGWPAGFRDSERRWYGLAIRGRVIGYNTDRVKADEAPKSLEELLEAKWKGRIVMARPEFGTTGGDVSSWFVEFGTDKARAILEGLKNNNIMIVDGNSTAVRMLSTGQADVCLTDTDDVYAGIRNGWNVAMNPLRRNGKGTLAIPNTAMVIKGGPNPEAAGKLMDFLLGGDCEKMLLESDSHNWPVGFKPGKEFMQYAIEDPIEVDYEKVAETIPTAIETSREILR